MAVYHDLTETEEERKLAVKKLAELIKAKDYHFEMGILGIKSVFKVLSEYGYTDVLYKAVTNESFPSYAYWINNGMTTLCESWEMTDSLNHHMYSEVDNWFYRYLGGINVSNGGRDLTVAPVLIDDVKEVNASFKDVVVKIKNGKMTVDIPKGYDKVTVEWKGKAFNMTYGHYVFN